MIHPLGTKLCFGDEYLLISDVSGNVDSERDVDDDLRYDSNDTLSKSISCEADGWFQGNVASLGLVVLSFVEQK